jgi:putative molybdopterin biosynthesis protein
MSRTAETSRGLSPQAAYAQWMDSCTRAGWRDEPKAEPVPIRDGLGRVTAVPVHARWPSPRSACAAMDGIAIRADSVPGPAGADGRWSLDAPSFTWVDTGDPMPAGMDTVVERERVELCADGSAQVTGPVPRGLHVRAAGEDFRAGQLLIPGGRWLRPADLGAAAAAGHATLTVACRPVVAIIPTGDEIRPAGSELGPGEIIDSNSVMLAARAAQAGAIAAVSEVQPDDPDALAAEARRAALAADIVLVIAGSSVGRGDHTAVVLAQVGGVAVRSVAVRPGHPVLLGYVKPGQPRAGQPAAIAPAVGIPGYPVAAAVIFELFVIPLLAALQGGKVPSRERQRVLLGCDWTSSPEVEDWVPVSLTSTSASPRTGLAAVATPGRRGASATSRLVRADAWWPIPIGLGRFTRGQHIDVQLIPGSPW